MEYNKKVIEEILFQKLDLYSSTIIGTLYSITIIEINRITVRGYKCVVFHKIDGILRQDIITNDEYDNMIMSIREKTINQILDGI